MSGGAGLSTHGAVDAVAGQRHGVVENGALLKVAGLAGGVGVWKVRRGEEEEDVLGLAKHRKGVSERCCGWSVFRVERTGRGLGGKRARQVSAREKNKGRVASTRDL